MSRDAIGRAIVSPLFSLLGIPLPEEDGPRIHSLFFDESNAVSPASSRSRAPLYLKPGQAVRIVVGDEWKLTQRPAAGEGITFTPTRHEGSAAQELRFTIPEREVPGTEDQIVLRKGKDESIRFDLRVV